MSLDEFVLLPPIPPVFQLICLWIRLHKTLMKAWCLHDGRSKWSRLCHAAEKFCMKDLKSESTYLLQSGETEPVQSTEPPFGSAPQHLNTFEDGSSLRLPKPAAGARIALASNRRWPALTFVFKSVSVYKPRLNPVHTRYPDTHVCVSMTDKKKKKRSS